MIQDSGAVFPSFCLESGFGPIKSWFLDTSVIYPTSLSFSLHFFCRSIPVIWQSSGFGRRRRRRPWIFWLTDRAITRLGVLRATFGEIFQVQFHCLHKHDHEIYKHKLDLATICPHWAFTLPTIAPREQRSKPMCLSQFQKFLFILYHLFVNISHETPLRSHFEDVLYAHGVSQIWQQILILWFSLLNQQFWCICLMLNKIDIPSCMFWF